MNGQRNEPWAKSKCPSNDDDDADDLGNYEEIGDKIGVNWF